MSKHTHDTILCPRCRGNLSITGHRGQATCPHCQAPVLFADADDRDQDCLGLPAEFGAFIADSVAARRGSEVILHGWHRSGNPEIVIKLWPQSGAKPPKQNRHPNVVRSLNSGTEAGFDYQVYEWAEDSSLNSAAELLTSPECQSPRETVSQPRIRPIDSVDAAVLPGQSVSPPWPIDAETTDTPPLGAHWRGRFNRRFHEGLVRGLGTKGLGCSMPMARFLADGACVSLYAICLTLIAVQFVGESIVDAVWAAPWLSWQWFWLRHYRSILSRTAITIEVIAVVLLVAMSLMNDLAFWRSLYAAMVVDAILTAIVVWRTLRFRFGKATTDGAKKNDGDPFAVEPRPANSQSTPTKPDFFENIPIGWQIGFYWIIVAIATYWYSGGTRMKMPGGKWQEFRKPSDAPPVRRLNLPSEPN